MVKTTIVDMKSGLELVITSARQNYQVSSKTVIEAPDGELVQIWDLKVPCDVELTATKGKGRSRFAQHIKILRYHQNAYRGVAE